jgi:diacylglycerol kinase
MTIDFGRLLSGEWLNARVEFIMNFASQNRPFSLAKKAKDTAGAAVYIAICDIIISTIFILRAK